MPPPTSEAGSVGRGALGLSARDPESEGETPSLTVLVTRVVGRSEGLWFCANEDD